MNQARFQEITSKYPGLRIAVLGDICLDRYLEIDPAKGERSIETGLDVHNVVNVRSQPGAAGTILNNLVALGVGRIVPIGFCGEDGEGFELVKALNALPGLNLDCFLKTDRRRTFTYCKPLVLAPGQPPRELNRLDSKNWTPTPTEVSQRIVTALESIAPVADALIIMDQVDVPETGVVTRRVLEAIGALISAGGRWTTLADSRRGLKDFPCVGFKMNARELAVLMGRELKHLSEIQGAASALSLKTGQPVFVTLAERGIVGADAHEHVEHVPALPVRGDIDVVGAGDAVTANLVAALAAGATLREALELAMAAASIVIHQLGTTGTARVPDLGGKLFST
jgi:rfaE bifunctional protein kinase chain/domain